MFSLKSSREHYEAAGEDVASRDVIGMFNFQHELCIHEETTIMYIRFVTYGYFMERHTYVTVYIFLYFLVQLILCNRGYNITVLLIGCNTYLHTSTCKVYRSLWISF